MFNPLAPLKTAELPLKDKPNWKLTGPGAILVGLSIGAGEIIIWPRLTAEYGGVLIWAAMMGVFLQMWINFEIGRWTIATGETIYTGFCRTWRWFGPLFILLNVLGWIAPGWGRASGLALKALLVEPDGWGSDTFWTAVTFAGVALVLFGPKIVYNSVERTVEVLVILITIGLIVIAIVVGTGETWKTLGKGMIGFGQMPEQGARQLRIPAAGAAAALDGGEVTPELRAALKRDLELTDAELDRGVSIETVAAGAQWTITIPPPPNADAARAKSFPVTLRGDEHGHPAALVAQTPPPTVKVLFIAIVFAGAGGTANLFYTFYLRDKHIGMGKRIPSMHNPLRGRTEKAPATGYRFESNSENRKRFRGWWSFVWQDQVMYFWLLNTFTMLLFIFGALAVLHPEALVPGTNTLIWDESVILENKWGLAGRYIFLFVGMATLFTTQLTILDGVSRSIADIIYTNFRGADKRDVSWWYLIIAGTWMIVGIALTYVAEVWQDISALGFLFSAAYMGGFAMAIYVPLTLWINFRHLPKTARPGPVCTFMMIVASFIYVGFAVSCLLWEFGLA